MQDAYVLPLVATVFLIVFSVGLGYLKLRYLGFGLRGLLKLQVDYEERRRTEIGKMARPPLLVRHAKNPWHLFGWSIGPTLMSGMVLLWLYWSGPYALVTFLAVPLAVALLALGWWIQRELVPMYRADFDEYLRLTALGNRSFVGELKDRDVSFCPEKEPTENLLSGGKLVSAFVEPRKGGPTKCRRLFLPLSVHPVPTEWRRVRIFYRPDAEVQGHAVDGSVVGYQPAKPEPRPKRDSTFEEFERRIAAKY